MAGGKNIFHKPHEEGLSIFDHQPFLKDGYTRLVLISHSRHIKHLDPTDTDSLAVSTDWLVWRRCVDAGIHCIHYESVLVDGCNERGVWDDLYLESGHWVYRDGKDVTLFKGISIGKQFIREVGLALLYHEHMRFALDKLCKTFSPREIVVYDYRADFDLIDDNLKKPLIDSVVGKLGIKVIYRLDCPVPGDSELPDIPSYGFENTEKGVRPLLRYLYAKVVDALFSLRWITGGRYPKIFLFPSQLMWEGLMDNFQGRKIAPVLLAEFHSKKITFIVDCLKKGILLSCLPNTRLTPDEREKIDNIIVCIEESWDASSFRNHAFIRSFIKNRFIDRGRFHTTAKLIKRYCKLFDRHSFARVMVSDCCTTHPRISLEAANRRGIPCDELLNGVFLGNRKHEARCGDGFSPPLIDRLLSWGKQNEDWVLTTKAKVRTVRTGYPALDVFLKKPIASKKRQQGNALILAYPPQGDDTFSVRANTYTYLIQFIIMLRDRGYENIRIKLHPGIDSKIYYERILEYFNLNYPVYKSSPLRTHLEWADFVIGPVTSGAMPETLINGKPYYPIWLKPSSLDSNYLKELPVFSTASEVAEHLDSGKEFDGSEILKYFCATDEISNASDNVWTALEKP